MTEQFSTAFFRAALGGLLTGLLTLLTVLQQAATDDPQRVEKAAIAGGIALLAYVISRGGIEGAVDSSRAAGVRSGTEAPIASDIVTPA